MGILRVNITKTISRTNFEMSSSSSRMEKLNGQPRDIAISDSNIIFVVCGSSICMYKEQQGALITHPLDYEPTCIAVSPQGTQIAVGGKVNSPKSSLEKNESFV